MTAHAYAQATEAQKQSNPPGIAKAGEHFGLQLDLPSSYSVITSVNIAFHNVLLDPTKGPPAGVVWQFGCDGMLSVGQKSILLDCNLPRDLQGGEYISYDRVSLSRRGYANGLELKTSPKSVQIMSEDPATPSEAATAVSSIRFTEAQILRGKANALQGILDTLTTRTHDNSADTPALRNDLIEAVRSADRQVLEAQQDITRNAKPNDAAKWIMFEDFHRYYLTSLVELRAPVKADATRGHFVVTSFEQRPKTQESITIQERKGNFSYSLGLVASAVVDLLSENIAAFKKAANSETGEFHFPIHSSPDNARVFYVRIGEAETDYGIPTDIGKAKLKYAKWTFIFRHPGCQDYVIKPNLYDHEADGISVQLTCK